MLFISNISQNGVRSQQIKPKTRKEGSGMEEIKKELIEIVKQQLEFHKKNKTVPSQALLDTISTLNMIICSCFH